MSALLAPTVVRTHPVMGTMASVHVHDQADPSVVDACGRRDVVGARSTRADLLDLSLFERGQPYQPRRPPLAGCLTRGDRSGRCVYLAGTRQRRRVPGPPARRPIDRSGGIREGMGRRTCREVPRSGRTPEVVPIHRRRHPDAWYGRRRIGVADRDRGSEQQRSACRSGRSWRSSATQWQRRAPQHAVVICGMAEQINPSRRWHR